MNYNDGATIPSQYKPISAWGYVGYNLLFSIPLVGLILAIVFAFNDDNLNRRAYARSFFCMLLLALAVSLVVVLLATVYTVRLDAPALQMMRVMPQ